MRASSIFILFTVCLSTSFAQNFTTGVIKGVPNLVGGDMEWGDYDNDGDPDLVITGWDGIEPVSRLYKNEGSNNFKVIQSPLLDVYNSNVEWGDYNGDGYLDLLLTGKGRDNKCVTRIYRNKGNDEFVDINASILQLSDGSASWGAPFDGTFRDIIITGRNDDGNIITILYKGSKEGYFDSGLKLEDGVVNGKVALLYKEDDTSPDIVLSGTDKNGSVVFKVIDEVDGQLIDISEYRFGLTLFSHFSWGDIDKDGDQDLVTNTYTTSGEGEIKIFIKEQNDYQESQNTLPGIEVYTKSYLNQVNVDYSEGLLQLIDIDLDQDLDIILVGHQKDEEAKIIFYINEGNLQFSTQSYNLENYDVGGIPMTASWNDIDNDTDMDLLLTSKYTDSKIYINDANTTFNEVSHNSTFPERMSRWGDYDLDGDLDILFTTSIFRNDGVLPAVYDTEEVNIDNFLTYINWGGSFLNGGGGEGFLGNYVDKTQLVSIEIVFGPDKTQYAHRFTVPQNSGTNGDGGAGVPSSEYNYEDYIQVPFEVWDITNNRQLMVSFRDQERDGVYNPNVADNDDPSYLTNREYILVHSYPYDNSVPHPDIALNGGVTNGTIYTFWPILSDGYTWDESNLPDAKIIVHTAMDLTFTDIQVGLQGEGYSSLNSDGYFSDWTDFDNDGDLDVVILGNGFEKEDSFGESRERRIVFYRNEGNDNFQEFFSKAMYRKASCSGDWVDYDGDGDEDLVLAGLDYVNIFDPRSFLTIFKNDIDVFTLIDIPQGEEIMREVYALGDAIFPYPRARVKWIDVDQDDAPDIYFSVENRFSFNYTKLLVNNGGDQFTDLYPPNQGVNNGSMVFGDFDSDGDPDVFLTGEDADQEPLSLIYQNDGTNKFTFFPTNIEALKEPVGIWGDLDNDGDLDLLTMGLNVQGEPSTFLNTNDGTGNFTALSIFTDLTRGAIAITDLEQDKDVDILISGLDNAGIPQMIQYQNDAAVQNTNPSSPQNISITVNENQVEISWDAGADFETMDEGLTYNIRLSKDGEEVISGESLSNGQRTISRIGNIGNLKKINLTLDSGSYEFGVQSIDNNFQGSAFMVDSPFVVTTPLITSLFKKLSLESTFGTSNPDIVDLDNDGDLDLVHTKGFIENNGNLNFKNIENSTDFYRSLFVDFNNDGLLDIVKNGIFYVNEGGFQFTLVEALPVSGSLTSLDFDNDGDMDILNGKNILRNNGNGNFNLIEDVLTSQSQSFSNVNLINNAGDFDKDGDIDVLSTNYLTGLAFLFENNGKNSYTEVKSFNYEEGQYTNLANWMDYDGDGDLDISYYENNTIYMLENEAGQFTNVISMFETAEYGINSLADYDNDGDLDLFTGPTWQSPIMIFENIGETYQLADYLQVFGSELEGSLSWGDLDNDGDLDFINNSSLYLNLSEEKNTLPSPPSELNTIFEERQISLQWNQGADIESPADALSYSYYLRSGNDTIIHSAGNQKGILSANTSGLLNSFAILKNLPDGTYNWAVQAIDPGYSSSVFSAEDAFTIESFSQQLSPDFDGNISSALEFGDIDADGDLDVLIGGSIYVNENGEFTSLNLQNEFGVVSNATLGDFDRDGFLDILGLFIDNGNYTSKILTFEDNFNFKEIVLKVPAPEPVLVFGLNNKLDKWGDYDGDGDLDILISGTNQTDGKIYTTVYRNDGDYNYSETVSFVVLPNSNLLQIFDPNMVWVDYDNDGDLDIYTFGDIYKNQGNDQFNAIGLNLHDGPVDWGDYDNDGDLDLLKGNIYRNDSTNGFRDIETGISSNGELRWGDYDADGLLDIVTIVEDDPSLTIRYTSSIFKNIGDDQFEDMQVDLPEFSYRSSFFLGDYDNDNKLDIIIGGDDINPSKSFTRLFNNRLSSNNSIPNTPTGLTSILQDTSVLLSWESAVDNETSSSGLSYNVYLRSDSAISITAQSLENGKRQVIGIGNVGLRTHFEFNDLVDGNYYWSVQAIDHNFAGGSFSPEQMFLNCYSFENDTSAIHIVNENFALGSRLSFEGTIPENTVSFEWDLGDGTRLNELNMTYIYQSPGTYMVNLTSVSKFNCLNSTSIVIEVSKDALPVRISNLITANGDSMNDFLYVENGTLYPNNELKIYDLYGELLYETIDYQNDWFATFNGKTLPSGQYIAEFFIPTLDMTVRQLFTVGR